MLGRERYFIVVALLCLILTRMGDCAIQADEFTGLQLGRNSQTVLSQVKNNVEGSASLISALPRLLSLPRLQVGCLLDRLQRKVLLLHLKLRASVDRPPAVPTCSLHCLRVQLLLWYVLQCNSHVFFIYAHTYNAECEHCEDSGFEAWTCEVGFGRTRMETDM